LAAGASSAVSGTEGEGSLAVREASAVGEGADEHAASSKAAGAMKRMGTSRR
jgi:hypothetical protein